MAAEVPNSYRDPFWSDLAAGAEKKFGLPEGLLVSILTKGEKSNNDQTNEYGTRSPFQITKKTRDLVLKRDGIDAFLSPENAAEVAGVVAKDGVNWAKRRTDDPASISRLAAGYYHGGGDTKEWGPRTVSYMQRVTGAGGAPVPRATQPVSPGGTVTAVPLDSEEAPGFDRPATSTFDRLSAAAAKPTPDAIANVFAAYQSGAMPAQDAQQFEADVNAGHIMLPRGATLKPSAAAAQAPVANELPAAVMDAYNSGAMPTADRAQLEQDVEAGLVQVPRGTTLNQRAPEPGINEKAGAVLRAGFDAAASVVGTPVGAVIGAGRAAGENLGLLEPTGAAAPIPSPSGAQTPEQVAAQNAAYRAAVAANAGKRVPISLDAAMAGGAADVTAALSAIPVDAAPTATSQRYTENVVDPVLTAIGTHAPSLMGAAHVASTLTQAAAPAKVALADAARSGVSKAADVVRAATTRETPGSRPTPGTMGSAGAAATDMATQRRAAAADLPVPIELTKGQAERTFAQQQFERETAKNPDAGAPLRDRLDRQNEAMAQNIDAFIDQTGAEAPTLRAVGVAVDDAVNKAATRDKVAIRVAYKDAEKAGELEAPVSLDTVVQHLNDSAPEAATAPLLTTARALAVRLGLAVEGEGGMLIPQSVTLKTAELFRKAINRATGVEPTNIRQAAILRGLVDASTEGAGGTLYKHARALRQRFAQNYENHAVIADILRTKRGTADRAVALEDIHRRTILDGSLDDVRTVRRVLQRSGEQGHQAWRELQGQTLNHIKEQALGNSARDSRGNPILSAAKLDRVIRALDSDGKLDFIFGKRGAAQLRTINEVAKDVYTSPPGSVNTSNTASVLAGLLDLGMTPITGLPLPVASGARYLISTMKNRQLAGRVREALGGKTVMKPAPRPAPRPHVSPAATGSH